MPISRTSAKKDGKQQYRVRINYTDTQGNYRQIERITYGSTEAKMLETLLLNDYAKKSATPASKMTIQELFDEYIKSKSHEVRATSLDKMSRVLRIGTLPLLGNTRIDKLTVQQLQQWKTSLSEKGYKPTTLKNHYKELRAMLNYAVKMEYIPKNLLLKAGNFRDAYAENPQEKLHYYTAEQFILYLSEAKKYAESCKALSSWAFYVFFAIAYYTGARKGEINALKWSDIDGDIMHIRRSIAQKLKGPDMETPPKNTSSYRDIQIPLPLQNILAEHKQRQALDRNFTDDYRVCGGNGTLRDTSLDAKNRLFANSAKLPHIRIHDFRHSHASLLANEGINIQEIARRLGHSNIQQTWQTYSHLYPREKERAIKILNKVK